MFGKPLSGPSERGEQVLPIEAGDRRPVKGEHRHMVQRLLEPIQALDRSAQATSRQFFLTYGD